MPDDKIADIPSWSTSDKFTEVERLVLAYTDCLALELGRVPDAVFEGLRKHLSELEILELTYITTLYLKHAVMSRALRTEYDDVDERITEIRVEGMEDFIMPVMGRRE
jgi:alkylhydroperoxidase family enzyme